MDNKKLSAKDRVAREVLDEIIDGLNSGTLTLEKAQEVARLTLATLDKIEKHEDAIIDFYRELSERYENFKVLYTKIKEEILRSREITAYRNALVAIDSGRIEEAKDIVDRAIEETANETTNIN